MAYQRSFKRPSVKDPVLSRAFQQIDEEFGKIIAMLGARAVVVVKTDTGNPGGAVEGTICINNADKTIRQFTTAGWVDLGTWT
jgi:hypothetical protein